MSNLGQIDPEKVAALPDGDYMALDEAMSLLLSRMSEAEFPDHLFAHAFRTARRCGAKVQTFDELRIIAHQYRSRLLVIQRLRAAT